MCVSQHQEGTQHLSAYTKKRESGRSCFTFSVSSSSSGAASTREGSDITNARGSGSAEDK